MYISRIVVRNFRNFVLLDVPIQKGVTCIVGENNTGKSNLLFALRLAVDANLSSTFRLLELSDLPHGMDLSTPQQVIVSVEFSDFADQPREEAMVLGCHIEDNVARVTYRFRPKPDVRNKIRDGSRQPTDLTLEDYSWELRGGGGEDPATVAWDVDFGCWIKFEELQEAYLVVPLEALRDVEQRLRQSRNSPLGRLLTPADIPPVEQDSLVRVLAQANSSIASSTTIQKVGDDIKAALDNAAGQAFTMGVKLGMVSPTFGDISRSLTVLLSNYAVKQFEPHRNGLGLNNVLYISMMLCFFGRRVSEQKTSGQLLLIEEPEAHLHPQLQRVLFRSLEHTTAQTIVTTHSTHITSQAPISSVIVLTNDGTSATASSVPNKNHALSPEDSADLERYLDATRATLLYARRVMLVEGPAELFLIPRLIKQVMGVDLESVGVSVIPIFGTHFEVFAKLFGSTAIKKRCAIVTDGDAAPAGVDADGEPIEPSRAEKLSAQRRTTLEGLCNDCVKLFMCDSTFEKELTDEGTIDMFIAACSELGATRTADRLGFLKAFLPAAGTVANETELESLEEAKTKVLRAAGSSGKGRFAQVASKHVDRATSLPLYIRDAMNWLME